jgi:hypothetical protein
MLADPLADQRNYPSDLRFPCWWDSASRAGPCPELSGWHRRTPADSGYLRRIRAEDHQSCGRTWVMLRAIAALIIRTLPILVAPHAGHRAGGSP